MASGANRQSGGRGAVREHGKEGEATDRGCEIRQRAEGNDGDQSVRRGAVIPIFAFIENALGGP
jgi:hypothetical protein